MRQHAASHIGLSERVRQLSRFGDGEHTAVTDREEEAVTHRIRTPVTVRKRLFLRVEGSRQWIRAKGKTL